MSEIHSRLEQAASHFRDRFLESWLFTSGELERQGFTFVRESSGSGLRGSIEDGEFYGGSDVTLLHSDGSRYEWEVQMLYETGDLWEQGAGYSYVSVSPKHLTDFVPLYSVGDVDLPTPEYGKLYAQAYAYEQDWYAFCDGMLALSEKCLADMEFVFRNNLTSKLYEMSLGQPDSSKPNPFLSSEAQA